jgi:hypothetical protein
MLVYTRNTGRVQGVVYHTVQPESVEATPPITTVITTTVPVTPTDAGPVSTAATTTAIYLPLVATGP